MVEQFIKSFKEKVAKTCAVYAKKQGVPLEQIQVVLKLDPDSDDILYSIYKEYKPLEKVSLLKLLGMKIDFTGKTIMLPAVIKDIFTTYGEQYSVSPKVLYALLIPKEGLKDMDMWLYKSHPVDTDGHVANQPVLLQEMDLNELFE